jgi:hypothetical protein
LCAGASIQCARGVVDVARLSGRGGALVVIYAFEPSIFYHSETSKRNLSAMKNIESFDTGDSKA